MTWLRLLTSLHGHVAILATALLFHPAILLRRGAPLSRGARYAVVLAALSTAAAFVLGVALYGDYRTHIRPGLFITSKSAGLLFETKEHAGFMVLAMTVGAAAAALLAPRGAGVFRQAAARVFAAAGLLALIVGSIGTLVTALESF